MSPTTIAPEVAVRSLAYESFQDAYANDPAGFVVDCIDFPAGEQATRYQLEGLEELAEHGRFAERGPHGLGKTATAAWAIWWFALTRDGRDWKTPTTASVWRQLEKYLWPEVHKWRRYLRWDRIGRAPVVDRDELQVLSLKLETGSAFAIASDTPSALEGAHADHLLLVFDEAKAIPDATFDALEGAFSHAGVDTGKEALALAFSTPGPPAGRFHAIHARRPGYEDWRARHVTLEDAIDAGRISRSWAEQRARQWGEKSSLYRTRVLGEFSADEDGIIPLEWVEAAVERWEALPKDAEGRPKVKGRALYLGVDVADSGDDENVIAVRYGQTIAEIETWSGADPMETTGRVVARRRSIGGVPVVDVIGVGSGVVARLREQGIETIAFHAARSAKEFTDSTAELVFANVRAAAWWNMREILDPDRGTGVAIPPDDLLISDLTVPKQRTTSGARVLVESKDDIKKRLGRSTDRGDAVVQAFFADVLLELAEPEETYLVEDDFDEPAGSISPY